MISMVQSVQAEETSVDATTIESNVDLNGAESDGQKIAWQSIDLTQVKLGSNPNFLQRTCQNTQKRLSETFNLSKPMMKTATRKTVRGQTNDQTGNGLPPLRLNSDQSWSSNSLGESSASCMPATPCTGQAWRWHLLPDGFIYDSYMAGVHESRMAAVFNNDKDVDWIWDITLGGKLALLRYGNNSALFPEGFQIDVEGSSHLRLDFENEMDMDAADFRAGLPFSYGNGIWQFKTGYYHVSSHLGDERILRLQNEGKPHYRINYVREAWIFGFSYNIRPTLRVYAEADFAFSTGECTKPWHFQFGAEYASKYPTNGFWGKPFAAINVRLLQEHDYDGNICIQAGWQWRGTRNQVFRVGLQYFGGVSEQYEHIAHREHKIGFGLWYDF